MIDQAQLNKLTPLAIIGMIVWQMMTGFNMLLGQAQQYMIENNKTMLLISNSLQRIETSLNNMKDTK